MAPTAEAKKLLPAGNVSATLSRAHNTAHAELPVGFLTPDKPTVLLPEASPTLPPPCPVALGTFHSCRISFCSVTLPEVAL